MSEDEYDGSAESDAIRKRVELERRAAKKILSYIFVFILQWIPLLTGLFGRILGVSLFRNIFKFFKNFLY